MRPAPLIESQSATRPPILQAETAESRASRLSLAAATLRQLETALDLLGIAVPEQM